MISKNWYLIFFVSFPQDTCKMKYSIQAWVVSQSVQATITEISQMGCLLNKFLSYGSEGWKSRIIALADLYLMRPTSWFRDSPLLIVFSCDRRGMKTLWGLFYKGTNPDHEVSVLMTSSLSTNPSFKYQHFGILILKEHKYLPIASSYGHFFVLYSCILGPYHHHHHQVNMLCIS